MLVCTFSKVQAQFDAHFTHYWKMLNFYNPAGAGAARMMTAYAAYSDQLSGFENNPKTMLINIDKRPFFQFWIPVLKLEKNDTELLLLMSL